MRYKGTWSTGHTHQRSLKQEIEIKPFFIPQPNLHQNWVQPLKIHYYQSCAIRKIEIKIEGIAISMTLTVCTCHGFHIDIMAATYFHNPVSFTVQFAFRHRDGVLTFTVRWR